MEAVQEDPHGPLADRPNTASTLSVWEKLAALYQFVAKTFHSRIMKGAPDWFAPDDSGYLVCWWVPEGTQPTVAEGMAKWHMLQSGGELENLFSAKRLKALALAEPA